MVRAAALTALVVAAMAWGPRAGAAAGGECGAVQAKRLFVEASRLLDAEKWDEACSRFERSLACYSRASTQAKVAICREHEGKLMDALAAYRRALTLEVDPANAHQVAADVRALMTALERRLPNLTITVSPADAANLDVRVDDHPVAASALGAAQMVDPGPHRVTVSAPGFRDQQVAVTLDETASREVAILLEAAIPPAGIDERAAVAEVAGAAPSEEREQKPVVAAAPVPPPALGVARVPAWREPSSSLVQQPQSSVQRRVGVVTSAAGVLTLAVAGYFALRTRTLVSEADSQCYPDGTCEQGGLDTLARARAAQRTGFVVGGAGAAATIVGVVLALTAQARW